jgi:pimeloyl-ACP methyl ester carboxylesterase
MNFKKNYIKSVYLFFTVLLVLSSCNKDSEPVYDYFVSNDFIVTYPKSSITIMLDNAGQTYPEINDIKPFVNSDIRVYKMVYNTTVNGKDIKASGLVCIPATSGEYPVLSFQNGTNTLNNNAPSEYSTNTLYLLIEFISSMGFIVVIPDYPGFGESAQIPHPYLIAEPTVQSIVDMLRAVKEGCNVEFPGIVARNEYYLMGYSQGGWATLTLHKSLELDYSGEFSLKGSVCGAGPYNMYNLFMGMINTDTYPYPSYLGYIINAYKAYDQFSNPVSDLLNEPYATRLSTLYTGTLSLSQINDQLTTSIPALLKPDFISGFVSSSAYSSVRNALISNSTEAWNTAVPLYFFHGEGDTQVSVTTTQMMYDAMIAAGTSSGICTKTLFPELDHDDALLPSMVGGLKLLIDLRDQ